MEFYDPCVKPRLIVSVKRQMSPVIPVAQLVDDTVVKLVLHTLVRALFRIFIGRAEFTGGIAAVDRF